MIRQPEPKPEPKPKPKPKPEPKPEPKFEPKSEPNTKSIVLIKSFYFVLILTVSLAFTWQSSHKN